MTGCLLNNTAFSRDRFATTSYFGQTNRQPPGLDSRFGDRQLQLAASCQVTIAQILTNSVPDRSEGRNQQPEPPDPPSRRKSEHREGGDEETNPGE
jgi:hypothetical protein